MVKIGQLKEKSDESQIFAKQFNINNNHNIYRNNKVINYTTKGTTESFKRKKNIKTNKSLGKLNRVKES